MYRGDTWKLSKHKYRIPIAAITTLY
jgi:hypothetical protein